MAPDPWEMVSPAFSYSPPRAYTIGPEVADLNALLGFTPDREQELILDEAFAVADDGLPAASRGLVIAGRQTVKSSGLEMVVNGWLFVSKEPLVLWSAHEMKTARESFLHFQRLFEASPLIRKRLRQVYTGINDLGFAFTSGQRLAFAARTTDSGRGKSAPKTIRDEELETRDEHLAATAAVTSTFPWAQTLSGSSGAKDYSEVLHRSIKRGREGRPGRYFHLEWVDDPTGGECKVPDCPHTRGAEGCRLDDPDRLRASNPTVGRIRTDGRGLTFDAIAAERVELSPATFARERLGWHDTLRADLAALRPFKLADLVIDADSEIVDEPVFAVDVSPKGAWSSIVVGGRRGDGRLHLETPSTEVEVPRGGREYARAAGDAWVVPWFRSRLDPDDDSVPTYDQMKIQILAGSDAASLVPALQHINGVEVTVVPEAQYASACGVVTRLVRSEQVVFVGEGAIADAACVVVQKQNAEKAVGWSRAASEDDISSWVAATLIAWHFESNEGDSVYETRGLVKL